MKAILTAKAFTTGIAIVEGEPHNGQFLSGRNVHKDDTWFPTKSSALSKLKSVFLRKRVKLAGMEDSPKLKALDAAWEKAYKAITSLPEDFCDKQ